MIVQRSGKDLDFVVGPLVVSFALGVALVVNFGFAVSFFFLSSLSFALSVEPTPAAGEMVCGDYLANLNNEQYRKAFGHDLFSGNGVGMVAGNGSVAGGEMGDLRI